MRVVNTVVFAQQAAPNYDKPTIPVDHSNRRGRANSRAARLNISLAITSLVASAIFSHSAAFSRNRSDWADTQLAPGALTYLVNSAKAIRFEQDSINGSGFALPGETIALRPEGGRFSVKERQ